MKTMTTTILEKVNLRNRLSSASAPKTLFILVTLLAMAFAPANVNAEDLTNVDEIIERANLTSYYSGADGRSEVRMTIVDSQGRERRRQFTILRRDIEDGGNQSYAVLFSRPADVRGTMFLVQKKVGGDDDRWLYLPDLDLVKRIAAGDKRTSFVGSNFFYEDVSGRNLAEDDHELKETTGDYYVVENTPKDPGSVEFQRWVAWIDKNTFLPTKMEYIDESGKPYRLIETLESELIDGHPTVTKMKVTDVSSGGYTVSQFRHVEYDLGVPEDVFTERSLRNPPRKWFETK